MLCNDVISVGALGGHWGTLPPEIDICASEKIAV